MTKVTFHWGINTNTLLTELKIILFEHSPHFLMLGHNYYDIIHEVINEKCLSMVIDISLL